MSRHRMMSALLAGCLLAGGVVAGSVLARKPTTVTITVSVKACPPSTSGCYLLRVPGADILLQGTAFNQVSATDSAGTSRITVPGEGEYTISARSFVMNSTEIRSSIVAAGHRDNRVDLVDRLVADAAGAGEG